MMDILVSFCNVKTPGRPALGLLDYTKSKFRILSLPNELPPWISATGLATSKHYVYTVLQVSNKLLIFDRIDLTLVNEYVFRSAADIHSIWLSGDVLYVVSTGTDEVLKLQMQDAEVVSESVFWRPELDGPRKDIHHLNAIYGWRGDLLISGFGKKTDQSWRSATEGFIFNISQGERMVSGIAQPHSLVRVGNTIAYCESPERAVRFAGEERTQQKLPGYARGLCLVNQKLFVGTSIGRRVSKSTGKINNPASPGCAMGKCTISRLSVDNLDIEEIVDLSAYGGEIYDLLPVEETSSWPVISDHDFFSAKNEWRHQICQATEEIAALLPPGGVFILVDGNEWGTGDKVTGRPRIPFLERGGQYWGPPTDDTTAIQEVERLRKSGAGYMIFAWPAFWWLDYYSGLNDYLNTNFSCVLKNERLIVYDLRVRSDEKAYAHRNSLDARDRGAPDGHREC
jgi:hypothetical protein